ncbi:hypothetical protein [Flavihumibacter petaseus]|uniref:Uncharacterized protein n=1 Tax=Flavihumibacter petaseus NBRC 106054 TaxID=1220578 RepID=A0A0E9N7U0_9BACT|nr:hypothetical protein [Flavihumibacter petaseus]GAO45425.1 hypothetical protein FPE01S_05_01200 [Flavihumibacter petaseus NBRC 106054]
MKLFITAISLIALPLLVVAQVKPTRILGTFVYQKKVYNYDFSMLAADRYSFNISRAFTRSTHSDTTIKDLSKTTDQTAMEEETNEEEISDQPDKTGKNGSDTTNAGALPLSGFDVDGFVTLFTEIMTEIQGATDNDTLGNVAREVFFSIKARLQFVDDEPVTAYLILKKDRINSFLKNNSSTYYRGVYGLLYFNHFINHVSVETEGGAIKNITVQVVDTSLAARSIQSPRDYIEFKNQFPISISGKFDPEKFANIKLYAYNAAGIRGLTRYIKMGDLLTLNIVLESEKEDYSPSDRTVALSPANPIAELKKEKRSRILEIAAFTDFIGLDQEEPNGLIQIEARRKININSKSNLLINASKDELSENVQFGKIEKTVILERKKKKVLYGLKLRGSNTKYLPLTKAEKDKLIVGEGDESTLKKIDSFGWQTVVVKNRKFHSPYFTLFPYIEPKLLFSKLEQHNRVIDSGKLVSNQITPIQLYRYQLASFGAQVNIIRFNFPQLKFNVSPLNIGYYWFRTRVGSPSDSLTQNSIPLNSQYFSWGAQVNFQPDHRWGASLSAEYIREKILNDAYSLTNKNGLFQYGFDGHLKTGDYSKLFFRFRWTHEHHNRNDNFTQIQLGYSLNLFVGPSNDDKK